MQAADQGRLKLLQESLLALKQQQHLQLKLQKTPTTTFPVTITVSLAAPPSASRYDVDSLELRLQLSAGILLLPPAADALAVNVTSELPQRLRAAISQQLHAVWCTAVAASNTTQADPFGVAAVLSHAQQHFVGLITSCPQYIEAYEGVDSNGATQRRFAIVTAEDEDDGEPELEAHAAAAAAPAAAAAAPAAAAPPAADSNKTQAGAGEGVAHNKHPVEGNQQQQQQQWQQDSPKNSGSHAVVGSNPQPATASHNAPPRSPVVLAPNTPQPPQLAVNDAVAAATAAAANTRSPRQVLSAAAAPFQPLATGRTASASQAERQREGAEQVSRPSATTTQAVQHVHAEHSATAGRGRGRGRGRAREGGGYGAAFGRGAGAGGGVAQPSWPEQAARDMQAVQRRYGRSCRMQQQPAQQEQQEQQLQPLLSEQHQQQQQYQQAQPLLSEQQQQEQHFSIMLRPTDPLWGASRGPLHVTGSLNPTLYPAAGSLKLTINPSRGVATAETWVLQGAIDREVQQQEGRAWQLRNSLKWLENYAGSELDRCFKAQQQLLAGEEGAAAEQQQQSQPQQRQQQRQQQQSRPQQNPGRPRHQQQQQRAACTTTAGGVGVARKVIAPAATAAAAAAGQGGIRIIRATATTPQQQQQAVPPPESGDEFAGLRLRPLVRHNVEDTDSETDSSWEECSSRDSTTAAVAAAGGEGGRGGSGSEAHSSSSSGTDSAEGSGEGSDSEDDEGPRDELQLHGGGGDATAGGGGRSTAGPGGWAITLEGLKLDCVGVVEVVQATLQLACTRCSSTTVLLTAEGGSRTGGAAAAAPAGGGVGAAAAAAASSSSSTATKGGGVAASSSTSRSSSRAFEWGGSCSVCQQDLSVLLRPRFVHEASNVLAGLKAVGCSPLDLLPSVYGATCADCDAVCALRGLQVGVPANRDCSHCHRHMSVSIPAVAFIPQGPPTGGKASAAGGGASSRRNRGGGGAAGGSRGHGALVEGSPLPDNGACKHYRHSYRWLRFPCCGARFPCDLCHEEAVQDGHDCSWATRMVCGFCSREQPLGPVCKHCGKKLATSAKQPSGRNTRHWEGGSGCRDKSMLDRRDAAKHRGSKAKTKSAKSSRVGPKPWSGGARTGGGGGAAGAGGDGG